MTIFVGVYTTSSKLSNEKIGELKTLFSEHIAPQQITYAADGDRHVVLSHDVDAFEQQWSTRENASTLCLAGDPLINDARGSLAEEVDALHGSFENASEMKALQEAKGCFAGAYISSEGDKFILFTDKAAVRPTYYANVGGNIYFSSQMNLLKNIINQYLSLDADAVLEDIALSYSLGNKTLFNEIKRLEPGELLQCSKTQVEIKQYYKFSYQDNLNISAKQIFQSLQAAVRRRLTMQESEICFLSGGMDSRLIASLLVDAGVKVNSFNYGTEKSQDNEFARLFAEKAGLSHVEKYFKELKFPNWSQLMSDSISETSSLKNRKKFVWSGDGGSVGLGAVYIDQEIVDALKNNKTDAAARRFINSQQINLPTRYLSQSIKQHAHTFLEKRIADEITLTGKKLNEKSFYKFLMSNDQKRHLDNHFETIHKHRVELLLPFFDSEFLEYAFSIEHKKLLFHSFYQEVFNLLPSWAISTPWQTYPKHAPCPVKLETQLSYQWANSKAVKADKLAPYFALKKTEYFADIFSAKEVFLAMILHKIKLKNYNYLISIFNRFSNRFS